MVENRYKSKPVSKMTNDELREEFKKCKSNPKYFIRNYIKVEHQLLGLINFDLFDFQEKIIDEINTHRFTLLRKFRQAGCTTIACAYALWIAIFMKNKTIPILSIGDTESMEVLNRIKIMYDELPKFLKPGVKSGGNNKHNFELVTGCKIKARPAKKTSGRSLAGYLLIIDEAAFIEHINDIWAAVYPIISTGGRVFVLSTVNGMGNWYHEMFDNAVKGANEFKVIDIKWRDHPQYFYNPNYEHLYAKMREKDPTYDVNKFEETTRKNIGIKRWLQEYEAEFLGTGSTYVDGEVLRLLYSNVNNQFHTQYNNRMRVWKEPVSYYEYVIGADVSLGRELDYSAFHIINAYNGEQVAEFYSNKTPIDEFAKILAIEGKKYNTALILAERNTIGNNLLSELWKHQEYENIWMDQKTSQLGFQVTVSNAEMLLAAMEEAIRNKKILINSERTVKELLTFIINEETGRAEADESQHDDLVTALRLAVKALNELLENSPMRVVTASDPKENDILSIQRLQRKADLDFGGKKFEDVRWIIEG